MKFIAVASAALIGSTAAATFEFCEHATSSCADTAPTCANHTATDLSNIWKAYSADNSKPAPPISVASTPFGTNPANKTKTCILENVVAGAYFYTDDKGVGHAKDFEAKTKLADSGAKITPNSEGCYKAGKQVSLKFTDEYTKVDVYDKDDCTMSSGTAESVTLGTNGSFVDGEDLSQPDSTTGPWCVAPGVKYIKINETAHELYTHECSLACAEDTSASPLACIPKAGSSNAFYSVKGPENWSNAFGVSASVALVATIASVAALSI